MYATHLLAYVKRVHNDSTDTMILQIDLSCIHFSVCHYDVSVAIVTVEDGIVEEGIVFPGITACLLSQLYLP